ncbi:MAG: hypothetical protein VX672_02480 [Planctomycetota bacterium]|nr:hypothetical protein [Planctomycetota bacterium]
MAANSDGDRNNLKAGIFTLVVVALGFATIVVLNGDAFRRLVGEYNRYTIRFSLLDGVGGLDTGSQIRVGGLARGQVTEIGLAGIDRGSEIPPEAIVKIEVEKDIRLWSNAVAIRTVPVLGGSSWINITTIGGSNEITAAPTDRNGKNAVELPTNGSGELQATPGDGLLTTIVGPQNAVTTRQLLENTASFAEFLDRDLAASFDRDVRPALVEAKGLVSDVRSDYGEWRNDLDLTFDRVASAAGRLDGAMETAEETVEDARADLRMIGDMVRRNVARIDTAVANVEIMTDDGVAITRRLRDDTLARVDEALDAGTQAIGDLGRVLQTIDLEVAASVPTIRAFLQDALVAAGEMKLATIEIRRSPWRILYQPQPGELANENLFAAARNFTIAASEVRSAAESLQSVLNRFPTALENDETLRDDIQRFLADSLRRLEATQSRLFSVIVGEDPTGPDDPPADAQESLEPSGE